MAAVKSGGCVVVNKINPVKPHQDCNGKEPKLINGKVSHHKNGYLKNNISNGVAKYDGGGGGDAGGGGLPWMDWTGFDTSGGSFESCSLVTTALTHIGLYLLMFLGFLNQLLFRPKVARERNREGYAPLYNPFEQFFSFYVYRRVKHCFGIPICSAPGAEVTLKERVTHDYNWTFQLTGVERRCINLGSYNYLGFAEGAGECAEAAAAAARRYGLALCSPRAELGEGAIHRRLEQTTAHFLGVESAIVFGMGFATNSLALPGLLGPGDLALSDEKNHASLILGLRLARVTCRLFRHNDVRQLERLAREAIAERRWRKIIIVVEGIYSMEGSIVPLPAIIALKKRYKLYLYLDEAHSIGALGPRGRGVTDYYGVDPRDVDVLMGTFTKSFGAAGGYIAGSRRLISYIRAHGHAHSYAHSMSPPVAQQILSAMTALTSPRGQARVTELRNNTTYFRTRLREMGVITYGHADSPVVPLLVYTFSKMAATVERLAAQHVAAVGVGFPATPLNEARIRLLHGQELTLSLNTNFEYILDFLPNAEGADYPSRVRLRSVGGDLAHPLLVTARQRAGAVSWQLPQQNGNQLLTEVERTLCPDDSGPTALDSDCTQNQTRIAFSLHVSTTCASTANVSLSVVATPVLDWWLQYQAESSLTLRLGAPAVRTYRFLEEQDSVRLAIDSDDDVCAMVFLQNYTCPIMQNEDASLLAVGVRMTMLRSAGAQLSRVRYPNGFLLVAMVLPADTQCTGETNELEEDWLWEAVWGDISQREENPERYKQLSVRVEAALTRQQYLVATSVTLVLFSLFYALFAAVVAAQRWPACYRLVAPRAKLAAEVTRTETEETDATASPTAHERTRRLSTATFDSSEDSNSDEEDGHAAPRPANGAGEAQQPAGESTPTGQTSTTDNGPFGLPARLNVAALSRRRARVLAARSDRYLHALYTIAVFYALPVVQFVAAFQIILNVSGTLDICYYNFLCAHPLGALSDFNHVFSNLGYLLLGALFMLQLRRRRLRRKKQPRNEEYGIPAHYGLLSTLGAGMMVVALLSASYHVCPNGLNFQFDTAFMYVLAVVSMVKIYQSRHPDVNARAHATFGVLAVLMALVVWGVLGGGAFFWAVFTVLHLFTFLMLSLRIYYIGQFRLEKQTLAKAARGLAALPMHGVRPLYSARLVMLLIANGLNWAMALYGLWTQGTDIASHLLQLLLANTLVHMVFYLVMKLLNGERPRWYAWCFLAGAAAAWIPALYFFVSGSSDWSTTAAMSRHKNHECMVLQFYDSHDLWHMLSAVALYLSFNAMMTWDDGLSAVKRTEIAVF